MKKIIKICLLTLIAIITLTGCTKKEEKETRTIEYLLDDYVEAYTNADIEKVKDMFPPFYIEYAKNSLTEESLQNSLKAAKEEYGDDFNITYNIKEEIKLSDHNVSIINNDMKSRYKATVEASECYKYDATITLQGNLNKTTSDFNLMARCKYDKTFYLVSINGLIFEEEDIK